MTNGRDSRGSGVGKGRLVSGSTSLNVFSRLFQTYWNIEEILHQFVYFITYFVGLVWSCTRINYAEVEKPPSI
ncbi:MAG TPA: hypothetical protein VGO47_05555 [Chlamydiales bacterium]|nr:hypothetical protein [Chlamydiales bacterium]